ncbi:hypothetical protein QZN18_20725 [Klebsiella variicola]|uniref:hypothetical protein n=1 Tax=Klebsiella variicola TaxID=244366 RepID=UPI00265ECD43|nr:hypothetical protein [Klebsiella variicola]WKL60410.1 hypothetical protein QZN18_20725 [Klebsiella variicola]
MIVDEETAAEMQMHLVRVCRVQRNAHGVWKQMHEQFSEYTIEEIREAVKPVILKMIQSL